jgi:hypothetical protein
VGVGVHGLVRLLSYGRRRYLPPTSPDPEPSVNHSVEPLYRRVNTRARNVTHSHGGDYRTERKSRGGGDDEPRTSSMHGHRHRGLDYTPLYRFLLSRVGQDWDLIHQAAMPRLDQEAPLYHLVARSLGERHAYVCIGESSYYSGLYIDDNNRLQLVDPSLGASSLDPQCACCTHTFNGVKFTRRFVAAAPADGVQK